MVPEQTMDWNENKSQHCFVNQDSFNLVWYCCRQVVIVHMITAVQSPIVLYNYK